MFRIGSLVMIDKEVGGQEGEGKGVTPGVGLLEGEEEGGREQVGWWGGR